MKKNLLIAVLAFVVLSGCSRNATLPSTTIIAPTPVRTQQMATGTFVLSAIPDETLTPSPTPTPTETPTPTKEVTPTPEVVVGVVDVDTLNVRTGPGTNYNKEKQLKKGTYVRIVAVTENGWYKIIWENREGKQFEGWISGKSDFIKTQGELASLPRIEKTSYPATPTPIPTETPTPRPEYLEKLKKQKGGAVIILDPSMAKRGYHSVSYNLERFPDAQERFREAIDLTVAHAIVDNMLITDRFIDGGYWYDLDESSIVAFKKEMKEKGLSGVDGAMKLIQEKRAKGEPVWYPIFADGRRPNEETTMVDITKPVLIVLTNKPAEVDTNMIPALRFTFSKRDDGGLKMEIYDTLNGSENASLSVAMIIALLGATKAQIGHYQGHWPERFPWVKTLLLYDKNNNFGPILILR